MKQNLKFYFNRLTNKLWFRPLIFCLISIAAALASHLADDTFIADIAPDIKKGSIEDLLTTISSSMLVIAIFAVGSMLSAFSAASGTATPRSFKLVVADDVSQNALSVYIGSFIFSIVATLALKNGYYSKAGYFVLFVLTITVFALVILVFLRWVERIAKLGRLGHTISKVEEATREAIEQRVQEPFMGGVGISEKIRTGTPVYSEKVGYIQHINMERLQKLAADNDVIITLNAIPGAFCSADKPLAYISCSKNDWPGTFREQQEKLFTIDDDRSFHDDPRFGLIALSEIASRALSPGINDPGTAIAIISSYVRLFTAWQKGEKLSADPIKYDRIQVPAISAADLFDDAFRPIARDGANNIEVMLRLQKAFISIAFVGNARVKELAKIYSRQAFERAEQAIEYKQDLNLLKQECLFNQS